MMSDYDFRETFRYHLEGDRIYIYTHTPISVPHSKRIKLYTKDGTFIKEELLTTGYSTERHNLDYIKYKRLAGDTWTLNDT